MQFKLNAQTGLTTQNALSILDSLNQIDSSIPKIKPCSARDGSQICWYEEAEQLVQVITSCCDGFTLTKETASGGTYDCERDDDFFFERSQAKTLGFWRLFALTAIVVLLALLMLFLVMIQAKHPNRINSEQICSTVLVENADKSVHQATAPRKENIYSTIA